MTSYPIRVFITYLNSVTKKITYQEVGTAPDYVDARRTHHVSSKGLNPFVELVWIAEDKKYTAKIHSSGQMLTGKITIHAFGKYNINFDYAGAHSWMDKEFTATPEAIENLKEWVKVQES